MNVWHIHICKNCAIDCSTYFKSGSHSECPFLLATILAVFIRTGVEHTILFCSYSPCRAQFRFDLVVCPPPLYTNIHRSPHSGLWRLGRAIAVRAERPELRQICRCVRTRVSAHSELAQLFPNPTRQLDPPPGQYASFHWRQVSISNRYRTNYTRDRYAIRLSALTRMIGLGGR